MFTFFLYINYELVIIIYCSPSICSEEYALKFLMQGIYENLESVLFFLSAFLHIYPERKLSSTLRIRFAFLFAHFHL